MILLLFLVCVIAAFTLGILVGPQIHGMIKACQDDGAPDAPSDNDLKWDPLLGPGDYWDAPKKPSKRKGKRKGK